MPTWVLASGVAAALVAAGWLFLAPGSSDEAAPKPKAGTSESKDGVEGVLELPDGSNSKPDAGDEPRRDPAGEGRLDPDEVIPPEDDPAADDDASSDDPATPSPILAVLDGVRIGLAPASAALVDGAPVRVRLAGDRVRCAGADSADAARSVAERRLLDRLTRVLTPAHAVVARADDRAGAVGCVDARSELFERVRLSLVVRASARGRILVARGIPADRATEADAAASALAAELGATLDLPVVRAGDASKASLQLLADVGAVDAEGGGAVVLVEVAKLDTLDTAALDALAAQLARALAGTVARTA